MSTSDFVEHTQLPIVVLESALGAARQSICQSKRGAVLFKNNSIVSVGYNFIPRGSMDECTGDVICKATCKLRAVHAEQMALMIAGLRAAECDLVHVKVTEQPSMWTLAPSRRPSCVECSKLMLAAGVKGVWLYHTYGWRRYDIGDFHERSLDYHRLRAPTKRSWDVDVQGRAIEGD